MSGRVTFSDAVQGTSAQAMEAGLVPPSPGRFMPGKWVRGPGYGKGPKNEAASYLIYQGRAYDWVGQFKDHSSGLTGFWVPKQTCALSPVDQQRKRERYERWRKEAERKRQREQALVADDAKKVIQTSSSVSITNSYRKAKLLVDVPMQGIRESKLGAMLVPMLDIYGAIWNYESICWDSKAKRFAKKGRKGGRRKGLGIQFGDGGEYRVLAEGVADALSLWRATGLTTICCFNAGNIEHVAKAQRSVTSARFLYAADHDNAGIKAAESAAQAYRGEVIVPSKQGEDFNDIWRQGGRDAVRAYFSPWLK